MKRIFWLGIGLAVGALAVRAAARKARAFTPGGIAGSVQHGAAGALGAAREYLAEVRQGMAEREAEIHAAFADGVTFADPGHPADPVRYPHGTDENDEEYRYDNAHRYDDQEGIR